MWKNISLKRISQVKTVFKRVLKVDRLKNSSKNVVEESTYKRLGVYDEYMTQTWELWLVIVS